MVHNLPVKTSELIAQHNSWISVDPVQGCPAQCSYCYLVPRGLTGVRPTTMESSIENIYDALQTFISTQQRSQLETIPDVSIPIAIGNQTDMCLTTPNCNMLVAMLKRHKEVLPQTPVCIPTKAVLTSEFLERVNDIGVRVIFMISLAFLPHSYEKGTPAPERRLANFTRIAGYNNLSAVHWWRPLTEINVPDKETARKQISMLIEAGSKVSVAIGLLFGPDIANMLETNEENPLHSYFRTKRVSSKSDYQLFDQKTREAVLEAAQEKNYPLYHVTSCAVSYLLGQPDYNCSYRELHKETLCSPCICPDSQRLRCATLQATRKSPSQELLDRVGVFLRIDPHLVEYSSPDEAIKVSSSLRQSEQIYLTHMTSYPIIATEIVPGLEWTESWRGKVRRGVV